MGSLAAEIPEWNLRWPYAPAVRARNRVSYLTARRFSAQDRVNAIRAIKRLKAEADDRETGLAAAEIALLWLRVSGKPRRLDDHEHCGRSQRREQFRCPAGGRRRRAAEPRPPAGMARSADQRHLASEGIPAFAAARNAGQANRRDTRN
jgi:hypothetical protein